MELYKNDQEYSTKLRIVKRCFKINIGPTTTTSPKTQYLVLSFYLMKNLRPTSYKLLRKHERRKPKGNSDVIARDQ